MKINLTDGDRILGTKEVYSFDELEELDRETFFKTNGELRWYIVNPDRIEWLDNIEYQFPFE